MQYRVLFAVGESEFNAHVTEELQDGWSPIGGVSVIYVDGEVVFHQAIVKKSK